MPKRKKAKNIQKEQPTHTPHPHNEKAPRSFHEDTPKFRKYHDCTLQVSHVHRCQVFTHPTKHSEVSQCAQIQCLGLSKTTLRVSQYLPKPSNWNFVVPKPSKSPFKVSKSNKTTPRVSLYSWGSGVSDYPTPPIHPTKHPHHTPEVFRGLW